MLFFLNKPLILEQVIVKAFQDYFNKLRMQEMYRNYSVRVTNEHPFSLMIPSFEYRKSLFPVVVISTESDNKPSELSNLTETEGLSLERDDLKILKENGYLVCDALIKDLEKEFDKGKGLLYGITQIIRRQEQISIEIWADNIQLKNEIYEACRLFVAGGLRDALGEYRKNNNLVVFDTSLNGNRSGNFNYDFGVTLAGARLSFQADYYIEQAIIDSKATDKKITWEVNNEVKRS